jgi:hypothetical protein
MAVLVIVRMPGQLRVEWIFVPALVLAEDGSIRGTQMGHQRNRSQSGCGRLPGLG